MSDIILDSKADQLADVRAQRFSTGRATVEALEEILYEPIKVLDHGFVRVVDYMGDDGAVVQAARVSYGKGTKKVSQDQGLINYLMRHRHTTPFEMCDIKLHIKLPIFVARQWIRHRTASVNEYSARYSILDKEFYIPEPQHLAAQSDVNNQGRGNVLVGAEAEHVLTLLKQDSVQAYNHYQDMLNLDKNGQMLDESRSGLARELARMELPVNYYTQWYWKINLHNLMHFLSLRADSHAQYEIRVYAEVILDIMRRWVPLSYHAFTEYRQKGVHLSRTGLEVVRRMIKGEVVTQENSGLTSREWGELVKILETEE
jgi:thymidylate synthase (FAD)